MKFFYFVILLFNVRNNYVSADITKISEDDTQGTAGDQCNLIDGITGICRLKYECATLPENEEAEDYIPLDDQINSLCEKPLICCPETSPLVRVNRGTFRASRKKYTARRPMMKPHAHLFVKMPIDEVVRTKVIRRKPMIVRKKRKPLRNYRKPPHMHLHLFRVMPTISTIAVGMIKPKRGVSRISESSTPYFNFDDVEEYSSGDDKDIYSPSYNNVFTARPQRSSKRASELKCNEYSNIVMETIAELSKHGVIPVKTEKCTLADMERSIDKNPIVNIAEFPHVAGIGYDEDGQTFWSCGGSLISEQYVLTSAHCTHTQLGRPLKIRLGRIRLGDREDESPTKDVRVSDIIVHPLYNSSARYNDLALLKLARKIKLNDRMRPACLDSASSLLEHHAVATVWDPLDMISIEIKTLSNRTHSFNTDGLGVGLRKVPYEIIDNSECGIPEDVSNSLLCVKTTATTPSCAGHGGGPLQARHNGNKCMYSIIGVTSMKSCEEPSLAVYTKISHFIPWIESIVWPVV